jgi:hypothetical protein
VEFSLDPASKGLVQTPIDITASVLASSNNVVNVPTIEGVAREWSSSERLATHHLDFGTAVSSMIVQVVDIKDVGGMIHAVLSDAHGSVEALLSKAAREVAGRGCIVAVSGQMISLEGRSVLMVEQAEPHNRLQRGYSSVRMGQRNVSERRHEYGCLIFRGSKCMLPREGEFLQIPSTAPRANESQQQAATRAVSERCSIYPEEFALLHDVPPAVVYLRDVSGPIVLTVFAATATSDAPKDGGCGGCNEAVESDKYDWYDFEQAFSFLKTKEERACVSNLTGSLAEAVDAGIVILNSPGAFGPKIHAVHADLGLNEILALTPIDNPKAMLLDAAYPNLDNICPKVGTNGFRPLFDTWQMSLSQFENERWTKAKAGKQNSCCGISGCGC